MQDEDISFIEFHKVLQEVEKHRKLKADIRNQAKTQVNQITKEQWEEKSQILQVSRVSVPFEIWGSSILWHVILWSTKTIKFCFASMWNQLQDPTPHLFSYLSSCHHPSPYFFEASPKRFSFTYRPLNFDRTLSDRWPAAFDVHLKTSYRQGVSGPKIISLYFVMVSMRLFQALLLLSYSFDGVDSTVLQVLSNVLFIYY